MVEDEGRLLADAGLTVEQVVFDNADIDESQSPVRLASLAGAAVWSRSAAHRVRAAVNRFQPDVIHIHNTFVAASPSVFWAARTGRVPVVHTVHNYRIACPVATCFRDGHTCTDCVGRSIPWPSVVHACVRGSHAQSAVAAATLATHRAIGTWRHRIDRYIALTEFQRSLLVKGGLPAPRTSVVPNFLEPDPGYGAGPRGGVVYVGRLAREKGIETLLAAAAQRPGQVRVVGDGPAADAVTAAARADHLVAVGRVTADGAKREMSAATALLVPSLWFEGFPLVVLEAFAVGTPVIASRIGSLAEIVEDGVTGVLTPPGDAAALANAIQWAHQHSVEMRAMGANARKAYEERYRGGAHLDALMRVYRAATDRVRVAN